MLNIGGIKLNEPFMQAPLSGYSDYAMRKIGRQFGVSLTFAGVMLAKSAACPKVLKKAAFIPHEDEHPVGAQILGSDSSTMVRAAVELHRAGYDIIDLNFACPAPKVLRRRRGGFLLQQPQKVIEIYRRVRDSVNCPVTMKLRAGYGHGQQSLDNFWQIISAVSGDGIDAIVIHPRTVLEKFSGFADFQILTEVKRAFPQTIIIGSGDLFEADVIVDKMRKSGIDGVAIARGAIGNPWIYRNLRAAFEGKAKPPSPSLPEQRQVILEHFYCVNSLYKAPKSVRYFRKFTAGYCKLHPQRKKVQLALLAAQSEEQFIDTTNYWYNHNVMGTDKL